ncbi:hypothetical protein ACFLXD_01990 [Chloroflexota bacterium]
MAAVLAGAEVIHSTVNGIGERAGNTPMEETALALLTLYGIDIGLNYNKFNELSELVTNLTNTQIPSNKPFVGDKAYDIESGILTGWYRNAYQQKPTEVFPVRPEFVGHRTPEILMGKYSGLDNVIVWSEKLGITLDREQALAVINQVKVQSLELKRVLTEDEFRKIAESVLSLK